MGMSIHVAKKYDVQYATTTGFYYQLEEFQYLLGAIGVDLSGSWDEDEFEVNKEELLECMKKLKNPDELQANNGIKRGLDRLKMTADEAYNKLQQYIDASDPNNDWMLFSFY